MSTYRHCQKRTSSADCMDWPKDRTFSILKCFPASLSPQLFNSQFSQTRSNLGCSVIWVAGKGRKKGASVGIALLQHDVGAQFCVGVGKGASTLQLNLSDELMLTLRHSGTHSLKISGLQGFYMQGLTLTP